MYICVSSTNGDMVMYMGRTLVSYLSGPGFDIPGLS